jgi:glycosyltransferase involved in cell wall biosynthesis
VKIAQISPLFESVPPKTYGGTERIVSFLTEELVRRGHQVTLFATADSRTAAELVSPIEVPLRYGAKNQDTIAPHVLMMEQVFSRNSNFDIIHSHVDTYAYPLARRCKTPVLTTLHGRLDLPELVPVYNEFNEQSLVSISDAQRNPLPGANWVGTVYHGLPKNLLNFHPTVGTYLAFLGRFSQEKRADRAIRIATEAGLPLKIAAKIDPTDRGYYEEVIRPMLQTPGMEFLGEVGENEKNDFLGKALGLLFPIDWPEPFGLVLIEAMACGTPVIGFRSGSVPEIVEDGVTGFIVDNEAQAAAAIQRLKSLDRRRIRQRFETRFSDSRMTDDYLRLYGRLLASVQPSMSAAI